MNLIFNEELKFSCGTVKIGNHKKQVDFEFDIHISHPTVISINLLNNLQPEMDEIIKRTGYTREEVMDWRKSPRIYLRLIIKKIAIWTNDIKEGDTIFDPMLGGSTKTAHVVPGIADYHYKVLKLTKPETVKSFKPRRIDFTKAEDGTEINTSIFVDLNRKYNPNGNLYTMDDKNCNNKTKVYYLFATLQGQIEKKI